MPEILRIALISLGSIAALFILAKVIGNKQMSQLNMFDYINGITIGSIAAEMATAEAGEWYIPLTAMAIYAFVALTIHFFAQKFLPARRLINGSAMILMKNGKLFYDSFRRSRLDVNEFIAQCRVKGFFSLSDIEAAFIEPNGHISILPTSQTRPSTPGDLNILVAKAEPEPSVVVDGKILKHNLRYLGFEEKWLLGELKKLGFGSASEVFYAACDSAGQVTAFGKCTETAKKDMFQ